MGGPERNKAGGGGVGGRQVSLARCLLSPPPPHTPHPHTPPHTHLVVLCQLQVGPRFMQPGSQLGAFGLELPLLAVGAGGGVQGAACGTRPPAGARTALQKQSCQAWDSKYRKKGSAVLQRHAQRSSPPRPPAVPEARRASRVGGWAQSPASVPASAASDNHLPPASLSCPPPPTCPGPPAPAAAPSPAAPPGPCSQPRGAGRAPQASQGAELGVGALGTKP